MKIDVPLRRRLFLVLRDKLLDALEQVQGTAHHPAKAPTTAVCGMPFDITVTALDPFGNVDVNYAGTVTFTSSDTDPVIILPANYTFQTTDNGTRTFAAGFVLITPGDQTITAADTVTGIVGSATVTVEPPGGRSVRGEGFFAWLTAEPRRHL